MKKTISAITAMIAFAVAALTLALLVAGAISYRSIQVSGVIAGVNLGVYADSACTQSLTYISWGTIAPGNTITRIIYVKNTGTTLLRLNMTKANWSPANANGPITLNWNRESTTLAVNQVSTATLTLGVSSSISGITTFSLNVYVVGIG